VSAANVCIIVLPAGNGSGRPVSFDVGRYIAAEERDDGTLDIFLEPNSLALRARCDMRTLLRCVKRARRRLDAGFSDIIEAADGADSTDSTDGADST
jgi:hypothetical protein